MVCIVDEVDMSWGYDFGFSRPARRDVGDGTV